MTVTTILRGGIGNNLFGIATVLAYSMKYNCDYCIPTTIDNPHTPFQTVFYSRYLKYCDNAKGVSCFYNEPFFHYQEIPESKCDNLILNGYFQSFKHFDKYREEILKILNIPYEFKKGICSIHVRRTDYLDLPTIHPVVTSEYLINAIAGIFNKTSCVNYLVFGDDLEWNKKYFRNISAYNESNGEKTELNFEFSENKNEVEDLSLASSCEYSIGSNSSYSWWIYYLNQNENKIGGFPKIWFGKDMPHDTKDLFMPEMILL